MTYKEYRAQALDDLKNFNELKRGVKSLEKRIDFLKKGDLYNGRDAQTKIMASFEGDSHVVRHLSQLEAMEHKLHCSRIYLENIENALALLSESDRELLTGFYINRQRLSVSNYAKKTYTDRTWLYRKAQRALERYIITYFGVSKEDTENS